MAIHYDVSECVGDLEELRDVDGDIDGLFLFCVTMMVTGTGHLDTTADVERFLNRYADYLVATGDSHDTVVAQLRWARSFAEQARGLRVNIAQQDDAWFEDRITTWISERSIVALRELSLTDTNA
jgi:hypothetical protein